MNRPDVAIVGAGVTGLSVALHLAEAGVRPVVVERHGIGAGASGIQPGGVRQQWSTRLTCELAREGAAFYGDLPSRIGTSVPVRFDACGYLFVAHSRERLDGADDGGRAPERARDPVTDRRRRRGCGARPGSRRHGLAGASWCEEDGYVDRPQAAVEAFAAAAAARGATHRDRRRRVARAERRRLVARRCVTARASRRPQVVLAAGVDTPSLLHPLGIDVPIVPVERHLFLSEPVAERVLEPLVVSSERHFAAKQLANGRILASDLSASGSVDEERSSWLARIRLVAERAAAAAHFQLVLAARQRHLRHDA